LFLKQKYPSEFRWRQPKRGVDFRVRLEFDRYDQHCVYTPCYAVESIYMPLSDYELGKGELLITLIDGYAGKLTMKHSSIIN
jgi:hypothetical protein